MQFSFSTSLFLLLLSNPVGNVHCKTNAKVTPRLRRASNVDGDQHRCLARSSNNDPGMSHENHSSRRMRPVDQSKGNAPFLSSPGDDSFSFSFSFSIPSSPKAKGNGPKKGWKRFKQHDRRLYLTSSDDPGMPYGSSSSMPRKPSRSLRSDSDDEENNNAGGIVKGQNNNNNHVDSISDIPLGRTLVTGAKMTTSSPEKEDNDEQVTKEHPTIAAPARKLAAATISKIENTVKVHQAFPRHYIRRDQIDIHVNVVPVQQTSSVGWDSNNKSTISVATQMSWNPTKKQRLLDIASRWGGHMSVAVYAKPKTTDDADSEMADLIKDISTFFEVHQEIFQSKVGCHLVFDKRATTNDNEHESFYPHNLLRNIAVENVVADYVLLLDVDFIPSQNAHDTLVEHIKALDVDNSKESLQALVVPAFERKLSSNENEMSVTSEALPKTKSDLVRTMTSKETSQISPFHQHFSQGHGPTDYDKWYDSMELYQVDFQLSYEPYIVVQRSQDLPPFWEHFTGFGKNKAAWIEELAVAGYSFQVVPDSFFIHINHGVSDQDARTLRPAMAEEYALRFELYLREEYGDASMYWDKDGLQNWLHHQKQVYDLKGRRICHAQALKVADLPVPAKFGYPCSGEKYEEFGERLSDLARTFDARMGRYPFPIPANKTVLLLGNSHTRQVSVALLCQYADVTKSVHIDFLPFATTRLSGSLATFENNSTLITLTNIPLVYSEKWESLLEQVLGRSIDSMDAIVLGKFNSFTESQNTTFVETIRDLSAKVPGSEIDFENVPAPRLADVAAAYDGPIISLSMFAIHGLYDYELSLATKEVLAEGEEGRTNIEVLDSRKYIADLGECGSDVFNGPNDCNGGHRRPQHMHRCHGKRGGHPDLMAWEVADKLHEMIE